MEASSAQAQEQENGTHPELDDEAVAELVIDVGGQLSMQVGGKRATSSSLRIIGGKIAVEGQFEKGQAVHVAMDLVVTEIAFVDEIDSKTRQAVGCDRRHKARIRAISVG